MNKRIKALAVQAGMEPEELDDNEGIIWWLGNSDLEKFADLIVRDSCRILKLAKSEPFPFDEDYACRLLKIHFGVE